MLTTQKEYTTDVLCIGGGIAALMAGIAAAQQGVEVLIVDKANTKRSGSAATGNDHFGCYLPEVHGDDMSIAVKEILGSQTGTCHDPLLTKRFLQESAAMVYRWEEWGIPMRPKGEWEFKGHAFPGRPKVFLHYDGREQKPILTRQAKKAGVKILNHAPVLDLIHGPEGVCGAVALDISHPEPSLVAIYAKTVILATGVATRLYSNIPSPGMLFNLAYCGSCTGTAQSLMWRHGGTLVNMEIPYKHAGPKFFARCGKASFIGVARYPDGSPVGPFVTEPDRVYGDVALDVSHRLLTDALCNGSGPISVDCSGAPQEWIDEMRESLRWEGVSALVEHMDDQGIDLGKHAIEFMQYEPHLQGRGVQVDVNGESSLPNVYAAGDVVGNFRVGIAGAAVYGWICGQEAAQRSKALPKPAGVNVYDHCAASINVYSSIYARGHGAGPDWREANIALQTLMTDYAAVPPGRVRSASLLETGLRHMGRLRTRIEGEMRATNAHELMRAVEVLELLDCGEALMYAALERKETRGNHVRSDFPITNPLLANSFLTVHKEGGQVRHKWREKWA